MLDQNVYTNLRDELKTEYTIYNVAVNEENGDVVCIERKPQLTYDIPHTVRLVTASDYNINCYDAMKGFLSGLHAGNYDITHIFIDNFYKMLDDRSDDAVADLLDWMEARM